MGFSDLALICAVALLAPFLALRGVLRVPVVVAEMAIGLVLGATGLGVIEPSDPAFTFLADIGFALVMFVAGSHVPMRQPGLRAGVAAAVRRCLAIGIVSVPVGMGLARGFGTGHGWLYAVLLASSSAGLVMPSLNGTPLTGRTMTELLPQVALADAACIVMLPLAVDPARAGRAAVGALVVCALAGLAYLVLRWAERSGKRKRVHRESERRLLAVELRVALALLFTLAAVATAVGVSIMLAGFAMGLAVAAVGEPRRVANQVFALTEGFFGPLFFVWIGATLHLREVAEHPSSLVLGLALGAGAVVVHTVPALRGQPLAAAAMTCAQLGVPIAAVAMGSRAGVLVPGESTSLLIGALVTIAVTSLAAGRVMARAQGEAPAAPAG